MTKRRDPMIAANARDAAAARDSAPNASTIVTVTGVVADASRATSSLPVAVGVQLDDRDQRRRGRRACAASRAAEQTALAGVDWRAAVEGAAGRTLADLHRDAVRREDDDR